MIIDSHQHFWHYDPERHFWMDRQMAVLKKDFMPSHLASIYQEQGINGCVAVQVDQNLGETDFLIRLANEHDFIRGIVGWVDFRDPAVDRILEQYQGYEKLKGWRHIVQDEADPNFLMRPNFLRGISLLEKYGFTYDILVFPHQLGAVLEFVKQTPHQKFIIDHMAKPYIKDGFYDGWAVLMREIAKFENVYCKLSGMITEADHHQWRPEQFVPYMDLMLEVFGPKRLLFGSDWPVCLLAGSYGQVKQLVTDFISNLSSWEQDAIMGGNAMEFYGLTPK